MQTDITKLRSLNSVKDHQITDLTNRTDLLTSVSPLHACDEATIQISSLLHVHLLYYLYYSY